jgi:hypothetical protein
MKQRKTFAIAQNMVTKDESVEKITMYTGLIREEVKKLDV